MNKLLQVSHCLGANISSIPYTFALGGIMGLHILFSALNTQKHF